MADDVLINTLGPVVAPILLDAAIQANDET